MTVKKGLGKGLGALIASNENFIDMDNEKRSGIIEIDINRIEPNVNQPRKHFEEESLQELAESIRQFGVIQPLIVKKEEGYYSIIAGERRWRAARIAKIEKVPVVVKDYNELETLQVALIENIQRADLNPIEEAFCYKRLSEDFFFTQEDIAQKVGKNRTYISNSMRLLSLDGRVQTFVSENRISMGHARALLPLENPDEQFNIAEEIIENELSVRDTEALVSDYKNKPAIKEIDQKSDEKWTGYKALETELNRILDAKVSIKGGKNKGKIEIGYYSPEDLDRIVLFLRKNI